MVNGEKNFKFNIEPDQLNQHLISIDITSKYVDSLYNEALNAQKTKIQTYGFSKGETPLYYIKHNFRPNILEHIKELLFTHCVLNFLSKSLYENKIVVAGEPKLKEINIDSSSNAKFIFSIIKINNENNDDRWKKINFKAPERKNYKDLDRQVDFFIKEEVDKAKKNSTNTINVGDWVCFEMVIINSSHKAILENHKDQLWVRISDEEADRELHELFFGKKAGDVFITRSVFLQEYISNELDMNYLFAINIKDFIPNSHFCFDHFKNHFQLKNPKEMHQKLIEVFSFRNDVSQRRETIEAAFKLLLKQYFITIPQHLLDYQKQVVLNSVHTNPDYHVYKAQSDFKDKIRLLAEKQLKERIIIDSIAYQENLKVSDKEIMGYINLIKRPRTKEFIYFNLPSTRLNGQEVPLSTEIVKQYCLREKTLNDVIYYLIKKSKI